MIVLFCNDCNGYESKDPISTLVDINKIVTKEELKDLEYKQVGALRRGGQYHEILIELQKNNVNSTILKEGNLSNFIKKDYDLKYNLISGNY